MAVEYRNIVRLQAYWRAVRARSRLRRFEWSYAESMPTAGPAAPNTRPVPPPNELYRNDSYTWALEQAAALRRRDFHAVDWDNVIEEVEDVGRSRERAWESQCQTIVLHMLQLQHWQPEDPMIGMGWILAVDNARLELEKTVDKNPGLKSARDQMLRDAWRYGRRLAVNQLAIHEFGSQGASGYKNAQRRWMQRIPESCTYTLAQIEDEDWWPEEVRPRLGL